MALIKTKTGYDPMSWVQEAQQAPPPRAAQSNQIDLPPPGEPGAPDMPRIDQPPNVFDDLVKSYWGTDRRQKLLDELTKNYWAPDKQQHLDRYQNMSEQELWAGHPGPGGWDPGGPAPTAPPTNTPTYTAPPGVDQTKLNNPEWKTEKYRAVRRLLSGGTAEDVVTELGNGWTKLSDDKVRAPDGSVFDLFFDYGGTQQRAQWTYVGGGPSDPGAPTAPTPPTTASAAAPVTGAPAAATSTAPNFNATTATQAQATAPAATTAAPQAATASTGGYVQTLPWTPGTGQGWQADPRSQGVFSQVAKALTDIYGRPPTSQEVWAQLNYAQMPDQRFMQSVLAQIGQMPRQTPAASPTAPAAPDPYQQQYEEALNAYLALLDRQRQQWESEQAAFRGRQGEAQASTERLTKFLTERSAKLQQPAYTGAEGEVFRTQAVDPIENDRQAANQRAIQNISARGLTPESGIAQGLQNDVNQGFDRMRASAQNELAYNQINEQRSREQEAQQLLGMIPQVQRAGNAADVGFLQMLDQQLQGLGQQSIGASQQKYQIPRDALQDALAALNGGGGTSQSQQFAQLMQLLQNQQGQSQQYWSNLGSLLPIFTQLFSGSGGNNYTGGTMF